MWPNTQFLADLVTFTEEIRNGKLHFLCSVHDELFWGNSQGSIYLFKNDSWVFLTTIIAKLILNVVHYGCGTKKIFHSRSTKTLLNGISFTFLSYWKTSDLHLVLEDFCKTEL